MNSQLILPKKVKLHIKQPAIMCSGRDKVECYYRGQIVEETENEYIVEFLSYKIKQKVVFGKKYGFCLTEGWEDLSIKDFKFIK